MNYKPRLMALTVGLVALGFSCCSPPTPAPSPPTAPSKVPSGTSSGTPPGTTQSSSSIDGADPFEQIRASGEPLFRLATHGPDFVHHNSRTGSFSMPELYGAGSALFDFDNDGDLDIYLVQGQLLGPGITPDPTLRDRLFRNELVAGQPDTLAFTDVTDQSGLTAMGYGMGTATGDYDGDGWTDLYVTNLGANQLWRNRGENDAGVVTFEETTDEAGAGDKRWSVSAVFWDFDADGRLDLYVGNYLNFSYAMDRDCRSDLGAPEYCSPLVFTPEPDLLLRNLGGGRFEDVSDESGIGSIPGPGLGAIAADFDADGQLELYVANDQAPNFLWTRSGSSNEPSNISFRDVAASSGCAVSGQGRPEASMGVAMADPDADGDWDLLLTHLNRETHTLYLNEGQGLFRDHTSSTALARGSRPFTGFGTGWLDIDNDGWLDLFVAHGEVKAIGDLLLAGDPFPYHQPNQLWRQRTDDHSSKNHRPNNHRGAWQLENISHLAGKAFELSEVSRGTSFGDLDNDGDVDILVSQNGGPARLLLNQIGHRSAWIGLELIDRHGRRHPPGSRVRVLSEEAIASNATPQQDPHPPATQWRSSQTAGSYASASDPRILVGLGRRSAPVTVEVHWLSGRIERRPNKVPGRYEVLIEGRGTTEETKGNP